MTGRSFDRCAL